MDEPELTRPEETPPSEVKKLKRKSSLLRHPVWGRVMFYGGLLFLFVVMVAFGEWRDRQRRELGRLAMAKSNLEAIGEALIQYEAEHGTFPPAYIADEEGRPMHSWRVLILPYLDDEWLYERYDLEKPWDHPENLELLETIPFCYRSPWKLTHNKPPLTTPYLGVSAVGSVLGTTEGSRLEDIAMPTVTVIEVKNNPVPWTKPVDISPDQVKIDPERSIGQLEEGTHLLMSDGSVRFVENNPPRKNVRRGFYVDRGTKIDEDR